MAALPEMQQQQGSGSSLLTKPRGTTDFFADSDILASQPQLQRLLNEWYTHAHTHMHTHTCTHMNAHAVHCALS